MCIWFFPDRNHKRPYGIQFRAFTDADQAYSEIPKYIQFAQEALKTDETSDQKFVEFAVGVSIKTSAKLIRKRGYQPNDELHQNVLNWIFELNHCSNITIALGSIYALGEWWTPPEKVRQRLVELVFEERRPGNHHPITLRGLAYRMLTRHDTVTSLEFVDTPARVDFGNAVDYWVQNYRVKYPDNEGLPDSLARDIRWLAENAV